MKSINYSFNVEKFVINEVIFIQSMNKIVYWVQIFGIQSLFVLIWFKIDRIVHDSPNIALT